MAGDRLLRSSAAATQEPLRSALTKTAALVGNGMTLSKAGRHTGLFSPRDTQLVGVGENSGNVDQVLQRLGANYRSRASRRRRVRTKLAYPVLLLVLALFVAPLSGFVRQYDLRWWLSSTRFVAIGRYRVVRVARRFVDGQIRIA